MTLLQTLSRWWPLVLLAAISCGLVTGVSLERQSDFYEAQSIVLLDEAGRTIAEADRVVAREVLLASSKDVAEAAAAILGRSDVAELRREVDVAQVRDTGAMGITVQAATGAEAKRVADAWAQAWRDERVRRQQAAAQSTATVLAEQLDAVRAQAAASPVGSALRGLLEAQIEVLDERQRDAITTLTVPDTADVLLLPADEPPEPANRSPVLWGAGAAALTAALAALALGIAASRSAAASGGTEGQRPLPTAAVSRADADEPAAVPSRRNVRRPRRRDAVEPVPAEQPALPGLRPGRGR